jgi:hypothetical protein
MCTRSMLLERTVRQRRIPWIQLNVPGCAANLATGNATDAQLNAVRNPQISAGRPWARPPGGKKKKKKKKGTLSMWVFLSARLRTWLLLAIALPLARLLVHRLAVAAERHDPSARTAKLLRRGDSAVTAVSGRSSRRARR